MSFNNNNIGSNLIITTISKYRKEYVKYGLLPDLYCINNDGTHAPLIARSPDGDNVYLYCLNCNFEKKCGLATVDNLNLWMRWRDKNPTAVYG